MFTYFQFFHNTGASEGNVQCFASLLVWIEVRLTFYGVPEGPLLLIKKIEGQGRSRGMVPVRCTIPNPSPLDGYWFLNVFFLSQYGCRSGFWASLSPPVQSAVRHALLVAGKLRPKPNVRKSIFSLGLVRGRGQLLYLKSPLCK